MTTEMTKKPLSSTSLDQDDIAKKIKAHLETRKASWDKNAAKAMELFTIGNERFMLGNYQEAADYYAEAYSLDITQPSYPATWAAVELKRQRYDVVEAAASAALKIQPRFVSARYQRLQGRKALGLYKSALKGEDARAWLRTDPASIEAEKEVHELEVLLQNRLQTAATSESEDDHPPQLESDNLSDQPHENERPTEFFTEDWSDSEDAIHAGNTIPCRHYNHNGCSRGTACKFSHSFDDFSVRDRLGHNAALPEDGWWNDPETVQHEAEALELLGKSGFFKQKIVKKRKEWWETAITELNPATIPGYRKKKRAYRSSIPPGSKSSGTKAPIFGHTVDGCSYCRNLFDKADLWSHGVSCWNCEPEGK